MVVPVNRLSGELALLQLVQPVPDALARDAETVQAIYQDYQELSLSRSGLKRLYGLSLTLSLLLALLSALVLAIVFSERLSAPLVLLAAGTRAVAQGDFSQRHPVRSHDELGILTASFNTMTTQLEEARAAAMRNQQQLEGAKAYVQSILDKLSAGVLSFDSERRLRSANPSARAILGVDLEPLMGVRLEDWRERASRLAEISAQVVLAMQAGGDESWEKQVELQDGRKVLLMRGSALAGSEAGFVVVFDDITRLLQAQRFAAWGEVARRLAHEIKNPLTPIQLSAERLAHRLADKLQAADADMLRALYPNYRQSGGAAQGHGGCIQPVRARPGDQPAAARSEHRRARGAHSVRSATPGDRPGARRVAAGGAGGSGAAAAGDPQSPAELRSKPSPIAAVLASRCAHAWTVCPRACQCWTTARGSRPRCWHAPSSRT